MGRVWNTFSFPCIPIPLSEKCEKNVVLHCSGMRGLEGDNAKSKSKKKSQINVLARKSQKFKILYNVSVKKLKKLKLFK